MNDNERAKRISAGDESAVREFVAEHYPSVLRFMCHLTRNREDAEDLTQLAFIKARDNIAGFRGGASLRTWLHRVAFHEYTHWKRRQKPAAELRDAPTHEKGYEACIEGAALLDALHRLPPKLREAFLLFEVQELSLREVSAVLRVPRGTVKSRLHHARAHLRTILEDSEEGQLYGKNALECN